MERGREVVEEGCVRKKDSTSAWAAVSFCNSEQLSIRHSPILSDCRVQPSVRKGWQGSTRMRIRIWGYRGDELLQPQPQHILKTTLAYPLLAFLFIAFVVAVCRLSPVAFNDLSTSTVRMINFYCASAMSGTFCTLLHPFAPCHNCHFCNLN